LTGTARPRSNARVSDVQHRKFDPLLFSLFSLGVWLISGLVVYYLAPRVTPTLLTYWKPSHFADAQTAGFARKIFSWGVYEFYGLISIPAALLIWKVRPRTRLRAFLLPAIFSLAIPIAVMVIGLLALVTMFWVGPWPYLLFTPPFTANIGGFFWAAVMGETRWRMEQRPPRPQDLSA
jgi:hypothetical protein